MPTWSSGHVGEPRGHAAGAQVRTRPEVKTGGWGAGHRPGTSLKVFGGESDAGWLRLRTRGAPQDQPGGSVPSHRTAIKCDLGKVQTEFIEQLK